MVAVSPSGCSFTFSEELRQLLNSNKINHVGFNPDGTTTTSTATVAAAEGTSVHNYFRRTVQVLCMFDKTKDWQNALAFLSLLPLGKIRSLGLRTVCKYAPERVLVEEILFPTHSMGFRSANFVYRLCYRLKRHSALDSTVNKYYKDQNLIGFRHFFSYASDETVRKYIEDVIPWLSTNELHRLALRHPMPTLEWILAHYSKLPDLKQLENSLFETYEPVGKSWSTRKVFLRHKPEVLHFTDRRELARINGYQYNEEFLCKCLDTISSGVAEAFGGRHIPDLFESYKKILDRTAHSYIPWKRVVVRFPRDVLEIYCERRSDPELDFLSGMHIWTRKALRRYGDDVDLFRKLINSQVEESTKLGIAKSFYQCKYICLQLRRVIWKEFGFAALGKTENYYSVELLQRLPKDVGCCEAKIAMSMYRYQAHLEHMASFCGFLPKDEGLAAVNEYIKSPEHKVRCDGWRSYGRLVQRYYEASLFTKFLDRANASGKDQSLIQSSILRTLAGFRVCDMEGWTEEHCKGILRKIRETYSAIDCDEYRTNEDVRKLLKSLVRCHPTMVVGWCEGELGSHLVGLEISEPNEILTPGFSLDEYSSKGLEEFYAHVWKKEICRMNRPADAGASRPADAGASRPADAGASRPADAETNGPSPSWKFVDKSDENYDQNDYIGGGQHYVAPWWCNMINGSSAKLRSKHISFIQKILHDVIKTPASVDWSVLTFIAKFVLRIGVKTTRSNESQPPQPNQNARYDYFNQRDVDHLMDIYTQAIEKYYRNQYLDISDEIWRYSTTHYPQLLTLALTKEYEYMNAFFHAHYEQTPQPVCEATADGDSDSKNNRSYNLKPFINMETISSLITYQTDEKLLDAYYNLAKLTVKWCIYRFERGENAEPKLVYSQRPVVLVSILYHKLARLVPPAQSFLTSVFTQWPHNRAIPEDLSSVAEYPYWNRRGTSKDAAESTCRFYESYLTQNYTLLLQYLDRVVLKASTNELTSGILCWLTDWRPFLRQLEPQTRRSLLTYIRSHLPSLETRRFPINGEACFDVLFGETQPFQTVVTTATTSTQPDDHCYDPAEDDGPSARSSAVETDNVVVAAELLQVANSRQSRWDGVDLIVQFLDSYELSIEAEANPGQHLESYYLKEAEYYAQIEHNYLVPPPTFMFRTIIHYMDAKPVPGTAEGRGEIVNRIIDLILMGGVGQLDCSDSGRNDSSSVYNGHRRGVNRFCRLGIMEMSLEARDKYYGRLEDLLNPIVYKCRRKRERQIEQQQRAYVHPREERRGEVCQDDNDRSYYELYSGRVKGGDNFDAETAGSPVEYPDRYMAIDDLPVGGMDSGDLIDDGGGSSSSSRSGDGSTAKSSCAFLSLKCDVYDQLRRCVDIFGRSLQLRLDVLDLLRTYKGSPLRNDHDCSNSNLKFDVAEFFDLERYLLPYVDENIFNQICVLLTQRADKDLSDRPVCQKLLYMQSVYRVIWEIVKNVRQKNIPFYWELVLPRLLHIIRSDEVLVDVLEPLLLCTTNFHQWAATELFQRCCELPRYLEYIIYSNTPKSRNLISNSPQLIKAIQQTFAPATDGVWILASLYLTCKEVKVEQAVRIREERNKTTTTDDPPPPPPTTAATVPIPT